MKYKITGGKSRYGTVVLDNKMTIILVPIAKTATIAAGYFVRVGSLNEHPDKAGISHFLEHMCFRSGTRNRTPDELLTELDNMNTFYNAATSLDYTYYVVAGHMDDSKKILDIVLDLYLNQDIKQKYVDTEKHVILDELGLIADKEILRSTIQANRKTFSGTPLEIPVVGNVSTVLATTAKDMMDYYKTYYVPENTVFVVTGNFNPSVVIDLLSSKLGSVINIPSPVVPMEKYRNKIIKNVSSQKKYYLNIIPNRTLSQAYINIIFPLYKLLHKYSHELDMLHALLVEGHTSRLMKGLRVNNGLTYHVHLEMDEVFGIGFMYIRYSVLGGDVEKSLNVVFDELSKIKTILVGDEEFKRVQLGSLRSRPKYSDVSPIKSLIYYGRGFLNDANFEPAKASSNVRYITKVVPDTLLKLAKLIFVKEKTSIHIYGNTEMEEYEPIDF